MEIIIGSKGAGYNLDVIDYKDQVTDMHFPWQFFGNNVRRTSYYGEFLTGLERKSDIPHEFSLGQNYPNPFNMATKIEFSVPADGRADLQIYDLLGRRSRMLYSGYIKAGNYNMTWDGSDDRGNPVSSGIYFYKLNVGKTTLTNRMTLIK